MTKRTRFAVVATVLLATLGIATPAFATSSAGNNSYGFPNNVTVDFSSNSSTTTFTIYEHPPVIGLPYRLGHGSVQRTGSVWNLTVCDDYPDGIGPYIDRDGGFYGTNGYPNCSTYVAVPQHWRVRFNGSVTPWFTMP